MGLHTISITAHDRMNGKQLLNIWEKYISEEGLKKLEEFAEQLVSDEIEKQVNIVIDMVDDLTGRRISPEAALKWMQYSPVYEALIEENMENLRKYLSNHLI